MLTTGSKLPVPPMSRSGILYSMAQRRHHYERAFEAFLRTRRIPYVAVDEAKKTLIPAHAARASGHADASPALKSFDFVIYGDPGAGGGNLLIDIKGRRLPALRSDALFATPRLESWVTQEDVDSLLAWEGLFGPGFTSAFVFVYACEAQPPDALFQEVFEHQEVWYVLRTIPVGEYRHAMRVRSASWKTVDLSREAFERLSQPFAPSPGLSRSAHMGGSRPRAAWRLGIGEPDVGPDVPALNPLPV